MPLVSDLQIPDDVFADVVDVVRMQEAKGKARHEVYADIMRDGVKKYRKAIDEARAAAAEAEAAAQG